MLSRILVGLDGSKGSFKALAEALELSKRCSAELHSISVEEVPHYPGTIGEVIEEKDLADHKFHEVLVKARQMAETAGVNLHTHVIVGHEVKTIVEFIHSHAIELLVIGFMGHSAVYDRVMGSTCQTLVRMAPCSVVVVK
jgi:nucleotide-binding universal stress UspA family protein